jgi:hypothetical protein
MKDPTPTIAQLVDHIATVDSWSRSSASKEHAAWLERAIAWDIVAAVAMVSAAREVDDESRVESLLRSGLSEVAAGPGDQIASLVNDWRQTLGAGACRSSPASDSDIGWARMRVQMQRPAGASPASREAIEGYARRAAGTHDFVRIDCGGAARLIVGVLDARLVPIMHE